MIILAIETTCDETSAAVVEDGRKILSNVVASSASMHEKYGGIVPEVAAREQIRVIIPVVKEALSTAFASSSGTRSLSKGTGKEAGMVRRLGQKSTLNLTSKLNGHPNLNLSPETSAMDEIDAIAVAYGPGLIGSLLVGVETAKSLALSWNKPLIGVNHLIGHIYANWLAVSGSRSTDKNREPEFPLVALLASGGHTDLIFMRSHGSFKWMGGTRDDSAGEAFDKVARILGLKYPGGPEIERYARLSTIDHRPSTIKLPRPMIGTKDFDFSFSGLKTAVVNIVNGQSTIDNRHEIAYEFQEAVCDVLIKKTFAAAQKLGVKSVVIGGGVSANGRLREKVTAAQKSQGLDVLFPEKSLSTDNGAMIAAAAFYERNFVDPLMLRADPSLHFV